ncbi:unnamed protein product [Bursaphelenchus xylophilus]|uniref:(pine wood nematode) hypothetical protein n=1 Tax=Bursaphelenchus xylophilus TaxID=6326 RepID=A0A1I7RVQ8_BURXY|nr:unnamed protein product [Bursaphelenchus xylophilus]CAG9082020.1 unnamed protein product [Bursaphelenchus xylophilus]
MGVLLNEDELPTPQMLAAYRTFEYVAYVVSLIILVITVATILSSSQAVGQYRWYLLHGLAWLFVFDTFGTLIGAVTLFPVPCYYGINAAASIVGTKQIVYFFIGVGSIIGKVSALVWQFEFRYYQAQPSTSRYRHICGLYSEKTWVVFRVCLLSSFIAVVIAPLAISFPDQEKQRQFLISLDPVIAKIIAQHPGMMCFSTGTNSNSVIIIPFILALLLPWVGGYATYLIYAAIRKQQLTTKTRRLQMMLFWSLFAQLAALFLLVLVPATVYLGGPLFGFRNLPRISIFCFYPILLHTATDCALILYFITPYRRKLMNKFRALGNYAHLVESSSIQNVKVSPSRNGSFAIPRE